VDGFFDGASSVHAADVDGDGDLDVLGGARDDFGVLWWENTAGDGTAWTEHAVDEEILGAISVYAVDVDSDGDVDVLGAAYYDDEVSWWENAAGDGTAWVEHAIGDAVGGAISVFAADMDGDGDVDALGAAYDDDDVTWWENLAGDGSSWVERTVTGAFPGATSVSAADVDNDDDLDVLGAAWFGNEIAWWENDCEP
jgi:hypothetical protein